MSFLSSAIYCKIALSYFLFPFIALFNICLALSWAQHIDTIVPKAHQLLSFLRRLRFSVILNAPLDLHRGMVEGTHRTVIQIHTNEACYRKWWSLPRTSLTSPLSMRSTRSSRSTKQLIIEDTHTILTMFSSQLGRRYRSPGTIISSFKNSVFPSTFRILNHPAQAQP